MTSTHYIYRPALAYVERAAVDAYNRITELKRPANILGVPSELVEEHGEGWYVDYHDGNGWQKAEQPTLTDDMLSVLQAEIFKYEYCASVDPNHSMDSVYMHLISIALRQFLDLRKFVRGHLLGDVVEV